MMYEGDSDRMAYDEEPRSRLRRDGSAGLGPRMERIEKGVVGLDNELDRLAERLQAILGPERPSPALAGSTPSDEPTSDLGHFLDLTATRLAALTNRLSYTTDRIDL